MVELGGLGSDLVSGSREGSEEARREGGHTLNPQGHVCETARFSNSKHPAAPQPPKTLKHRYPVVPICRDPAKTSKLTQTWNYLELVDYQNSKP